MSESVYRNYDAEALWAQYNNRGQLPAEELEAIKGDQAERSARIREEAENAHLDVPYGPHDRERMDIFLPENEGAPLLAFIHGGYWQWNEKEGFEFLAESLNAAGAAFANIEYTLCPATTLAQLTDQIRQALAQLWRDAEKYGYDRNRIVVSGHSAGGHLTAMMMATDWPALAEDLPRDLLAGALPISGVYDVTPITMTPLNDAVRLKQKEIEALSPMFLNPQSTAPMVVAYGEAESEEFDRQARDLVSAWEKHGLQASVLPLPGRNHFSALSALAEPDHALFAEAKRLLGLG